MPNGPSPETDILLSHSLPKDERRLIGQGRHRLSELKMTQDLHASRADLLHGLSASGYFLAF